MLLGLCAPPALVLDSPPQPQGSFGSRSSPWSSSWVGWSEGWNPWWGRQPSLCSSPQQTNPFSCKSLPRKLRAPSREKPIPFQCPAHSTSHQKAFHCFHPIIYCLVPCALQEMVLPNIFRFLSQRSLCQCLLSLLGSDVILDTIPVAVSSSYVPNCLGGVLITPLIQPWPSPLDLLLSDFTKSKLSGALSAPFVQHHPRCQGHLGSKNKHPAERQVLLDMGRNFQPQFPSRWFILKQQGRS